ncbi:MAG TPA: hypothetical protein VIG48_09225 [Jatrophihabitans sp.]|jgi:MFS family permease
MTDPAVAASSERRRQLRAAGLAAGALAVLGALLGPVWAAWSPPGPIGIQLTQGVQPDETEAWAAGDGRYALIAIVLGVLAAVLAWYLPVLRRARGPYIAAGLAVGALAGAALTDLVGWAVRGDGPSYHCGAGTCIAHLPLTVHMHGLWFLEAFIAVLGYGLFVAFAVADDLGRPDHRPVRSTEPASAVSVGPQHQPQDGGRHGDAAGVPQ